MRTVYIDLDDVLVDFVGAACKAFKVTRKDFELQRQFGEWDMIPILNRMLDDEIDVSTFLQVIDSYGRSFWTELKSLTWCDALISVVEGLGFEWFVVSDPGDFEYASNGKIDSLKRIFGPGFNRYILTSYKEQLAQPYRILIDDKPSNVDNFIRSGGNGILFPAYGNGLVTMAEKPLTHVVRQLTQLMETPE